MNEDCMIYMIKFLDNNTGKNLLLTNKQLYNYYEKHFIRKLMVKYNT